MPGRPDLAPDVRAILEAIRRDFLVRSIPERTFPSAGLIVTELTSSLFLTSNKRLVSAVFSTVSRGRATTCFRAGDFRRGDRTRAAWHPGEALSISPRVPRFRSLKETNGIGLPTDENCYTAGAFKACGTRSWRRR